MAMQDPCPGPEVWVAWLRSPPDVVARARWEPHLAGCASCRSELASLARTWPPARRRWLSRSWVPRLAAAAVLLLAAAAGLRWVPRAPSISPPDRASKRPGSAPPAIRCVEILAGASGEIALEPASRGRWLKAGAGSRFHLDRGRAWVESSGHPLLLSLEGCPGSWELREGTLLLETGACAGSVSWLVSEARAEEEGTAWSARVIRGEAFWSSGGERRRLGAGEALGRTDGPVPNDPRAWRRMDGLPGSLRDEERSLAPSGIPLPFAAEVLVRKRAPSAEAALLFSSAGKGWQLPLGEVLPAGEGWVRLRLEAGADGLRLLAGERELVSCAPGALSGLAYACPGSRSFGLRAWGGDVEIREARWRSLP